MTSLYRDAGLSKPFDSLPTWSARAALLAVALILTVPALVCVGIFGAWALRDEFKDTWRTLALPPWPKEYRAP